MRLRTTIPVLLLACLHGKDGFPPVQAERSASVGYALDEVAEGTISGRGAAPDVRLRVGAGTAKGLWPDARVYYTFSDETSEFTKGQFHDAFRAWETGTPLRFIEWTNEENYIEIVYSEITSSGVGMGGGRQLLLITPYTHTPLGTVLHEIGHAIGLQHEHQRSDRDQYVEVFPENVMPANVTQISLVLNTVNYTPYDFHSIMHYGRKTLSANGGDTIRPREEYLDYLAQIGQRDSLSALDREGVRKMYSFMPLPYTPVDRSWAVGRRPVNFSWSGFPDAEEYQLQVASDTGFTRIAYETSVAPVDAERWAIEPQSTTWAPPNDDVTYYWRVRCRISGRTRAWSDISILNVRARTYETVVHAGYPNPASGVTTIPFDLRESGHARLSIVTMNGREIAVLEDAVLDAGEHRAIWYADQVPAGVYLARLETASAIASRALILVRTAQ